MEALPAGNDNEMNLQSLVKPVTDALYVLNGKWKLPILIALTYSNKRFVELANNIPDITDRMLARELRELEANLLVTKIPAGPSPTKWLYAITGHGKSLHTVVLGLSKWGTEHRRLIVGR